ncbi:476_t:CDS:10 [Funneliformis caledonium]|uniref:476_t:CDS:1 n=1 Tax=Funneliformis caledonium TaxID=1117310 RepID=A0A9N8ZT47_9GLOM|nr:476_t:CDS:10 [Funneliformis caledonium]
MASIAEPQIIRELIEKLPSDKIDNSMGLNIFNYTQDKKIKKVKGCTMKRALFENIEFEDWTLATSNMHKNQSIFVAISCVTESDMTVKQKSKNTGNGKTVIFKIENLELNIAQDNNLFEHNEENFQVNNSELKEIIIKDKEEIIISEYKKENFGGIVFLVDDETGSDVNDSNEKNTKNKSGENDSDKHKPVCFIFNASGIYRLECTFNNKSSKNFKQFNYPKIIMNELKNLTDSESRINSIKNCIFDNYFHVEQYKEGIQVMELYDLRTMQIQQIFKIYEGRKYPFKYSDSALAISNNKQMIAFSSGYGTIALCLIENGLVILHKHFGKDKVIACKFKGDNKLMILIRRANHENPMMYIWHLYTNKIKKCSERFPEKGKEISVEDKEKVLYSAKVPDKYVIVDENGVVNSVYDNFEEKDKEKSSLELILYKDRKDRKNLAYENKNLSKEEAQGIISYENKILSKEEVKNLSKEEVQRMINNRETWKNNDKILVYENKHLSKDEVQLQVWRKDKQKKMFVLEYIWAHDIKDDKMLDIEDLIVYEDKIGFSLKLENIHLKWVYNDYNCHKDLMVYACYALEYLKQRNKISGYKNQLAFEEIKDNVSDMIERFIRNSPDIWKIIDIHYDLMERIINDGSITLIKYILFGDDDNVNHERLHIPRINRWNKSKNNSDILEHSTNNTNKNDLQIAIELCKKDHQCNRRILLVTYLLEYYSQNATKHHGWLIAISKALPDLYENDLEFCIPKLFYKNCMEGIKISNIPVHKEILIRFAKDKFVAFNPIFLEPISKSGWQFNFKALKKGLKYIELVLKKKIYVILLSKDYKDPTKDPKDQKKDLEKYPSPVKIVPLCDFTKYTVNIPKHTYKDEFIFKLLRLLFFPRAYLSPETFTCTQCKQKKTPSEAVEHNGTKYCSTECRDNFTCPQCNQKKPTSEAVEHNGTNYCSAECQQKYSPNVSTFTCPQCEQEKLNSKPEKHYGTKYCSTACCDKAQQHYTPSPFVQIINNESDDDIFKNPVMEAFRHRGWKNYFDLFNCFDLASIIVAVVVMSVHVAPSFDTKNAFANVVTTQEITIAISFTMLLLWFEFILYLRLIGEPAKYIYIMLSIISEIWMFLAFLIIVIVGLAHSFLLLLQYPDFTNLEEIKTPSTLFTDDSNFKIQSDFDRTEDNPAKNFFRSFLSTYDWLNGNKSQDKAWNLWAVKVITFFGSFFLVTILQNMFVGFMSGVYSDAQKKGRVNYLRYCAGLIADYEALDKINFNPSSPEPEYIYYIGESKSHDEWNVKKCMKSNNGNLYDDYEEKVSLPCDDEDNHCSSDDYSGDDDISEGEGKKETTVKDLNKMIDNIDNKVDKLLTINN